VPECFGVDPCSHYSVRSPCRHGFFARGAYSHFESSRFDGPRFSHRDSHPTRSNGVVQRVVKTSSDRIVKCWILKIFLTNLSTEPSTFSHSM
jgi:hypothetical protein